MSAEEKESWLDIIPLFILLRFKTQHYSKSHRNNGENNGAKVVVVIVEVSDPVVIRVLLDLTTWLPYLEIDFEVILVVYFNHASLLFIIEFEVVFAVIICYFLVR